MTQLFNYDKKVVFIEEPFAGVAQPVEQLICNQQEPTFEALILLAANCGLGAADLGRVRWDMIDLERRRVRFPRPKTGTPRAGFLWKKTVKALRRVRILKHNRLALQKEGEECLVFLTRHGKAL
ncbi:MAG: hypothetical protein ACLQT6_03435, partial [Desulfomonilaceae bacterium]